MDYTLIVFYTRKRAKMILLSIRKRANILKETPKN